MNEQWPETKFAATLQRLQTNPNMTPGRRSYRIARLYIDDLTPGFRRRKICMAMLYLIKSFFQRQY